MDLEQREALVRRLAAAIRGVALYTPEHPLVSRAVDALTTACQRALENSDAVVIGFLGDDVVADGERLVRSRASFSGFARDVRSRDIDKITLRRGLDRQEIAAFVAAVSDREDPDLSDEKLRARGVRRISLGKITVEDTDEDAAGIEAAKRVYGQAVATAEQLWASAGAGQTPDPGAARRIIDSLAKMVHSDRTSLMALTAVTKHDSYTFTHMVNVSALAMAQARALNMDGAMLREFGFAALMHDIGKVNTPQEILNKPDRLSKDEFAVMKRHVVDGAHILRKTPEVPALAPVVAFEHHLKMDLSGYPDNVGHRDLNLCTMIVTIADVFDALRSTRAYRDSLPTDRIRAIMGKQGGHDFNNKLLRRFINLMGVFPVGTLVRLESDEVGVVTHAHPSDPFRPQVKVILDPHGDRLEEPLLVNTWERREPDTVVRAVAEAVDPDEVGIDPLAFMEGRGTTDAATTDG